MKITPECVPCLLNRLLFETNLVNPSRSYEVMRESCKILACDLSPEISSAELATKAHRKTFELLGCVDPYIEMKKQATSIAMNLEEKAKMLIEDSLADEEERLKTAVLISIVGNVLDFGILGGVTEPSILINDFDRIYNEGLGVNDIDKILPYLKKDSKILFFADNCGEIVFDKLLCKELKKYNVKIVLIVKDEPILSDATLDDAMEIGMDEVVDEIITTGGYAVGFETSNITPKLKKHLQEFNLIISKGMGNFEALSELDYKPILYLLRTKCNPVASALGLPKNLNVAKLY